MLFRSKARNPYSGRYGKDGAIERFRLDRINDTTKSGRQGFHFDYRKAAGNALPEVPTPLPDLSRDLPTPKGQAMPDLDAEYLTAVQRGDKITAQKLFFQSRGFTPIDSSIPTDTSPV